MAEVMVICGRNVEDIRRKNIEDNQLFLKELLMTNARDDFLHSARSILPEKSHTKTSVQYDKIEYSTRYSLKLKSGELSSHIPEWQQKAQKKRLEIEQRKQKAHKKRLERQQNAQRKRLENEERKQNKKMLKMERKRRRYCLETNNSSPYQRLFKPRHTRTSERIQQEYIEYSTEKNE